MNPCSSSKQSNDELNAPHKKLPSPNFLLLPFATPNFTFNLNSPFFKQPFASSNPNLLIEVEPSNVVREVQKSFLSNVEKCLKMLSQNGVIDKIMSFPSYLENCCQIPRMNRRNLVMQSSSNFAAILPGDSVAGIVATNGILNFLNIYNTILVARLVLTWFPNAPPAVVGPLSTLCDPYLNIFRGIIPPLGGTLDLSPILAFLVLNAFTSAASALPAELPSDDVSKGMPIRTTSQSKWMRRLAGNKPKSSDGET